MAGIAWALWALLAFLIIHGIWKWVRQSGQIVAPLPICLATLGFYLLPRAAYLLWYRRAPLTSAGLPAYDQTALITEVLGVALLAVLAFNLMGDALRDLLDPRLRGE